MFPLKIILLDYFKYGTVLFHSIYQISLVGEYDAGLAVYSAKCGLECICPTVLFCGGHGYLQLRIGYVQPCVAFCSQCGFG